MAQLQRQSGGSNAPSGADQREFQFSDADFEFLSKLAYESAGIVLADNKRNLVYGRLSRRLRTLDLDSFHQYRDYLGSNSQEVENFINSISTNHTKFFRESHHFDHLRSDVLIPFIQSVHKTKNNRFRIWSAGCSSGEEPYTTAAVVHRELRHAPKLDLKILATDIDTDIVAKAQRGEYAAAALVEIPKTYQDYFEENGGTGTAAKMQVVRSAQELITFRQLNLLQPWPFKGQFDVIFCRNVMIYFDGPTKMNLVDRFRQQLKPGGWLYIGHSESVVGGFPGLKLMGRTIYRREA
jgi:chemotaxis protein methyltransferase CheR